MHSLLRVHIVEVQGLLLTSYCEHLSLFAIVNSEKLHLLLILYKVSFDVGSHGLDDRNMPIRVYCHYALIVQPSLQHFKIRQSYLNEVYTEAD